MHHYDSIEAVCNNIQNNLTDFFQLLYPNWFHSIKIDFIFQSIFDKNVWYQIQDFIRKPSVLFRRLNDTDGLTKMITIIYMLCFINGNDLPIISFVRQMFPHFISKKRTLLMSTFLKLVKIFKYYSCAADSVGKFHWKITNNLLRKHIALETAFCLYIFTSFQLHSSVRYGRALTTINWYGWKGVKCEIET